MNQAKANYVQVRGPSEERSYAGFDITPTPVKIVKKALSKFCTGAELIKITTEFRRSDFSEAALLKDFESANVSRHDVVKDEFYYQALSLATKMLGTPHKWRPVHFADLRWYNFPLSVSAEAPFTKDDKLKTAINRSFQEGKISNTRISFHNAYNYIFVKCRNWIHMIKKGIAKGNQLFFWITLHARSHLVTEEDEDKIRMVYGVPKLLLFAELMFLWPYFNYLRSNESVIAWGFETLNGGFYRLSTLLDKLSYRPATWLCLDWSQFDKRARFTVIDDVHAAIFSMIDIENGYVPTINYPKYDKPLSIFKEEMLRLYKWTCRAVKFTPIRIFNGSEYKRTHSNIASGLMSTQLLDTWVNFILIVTCLLSMGIKIDTDTLMKLLGDDSIIALREMLLEHQYDEFLVRLGHEAERRFGAKLNIKKSIIKPSLQGCHFLGYQFDNSIPKRDPLKLLAQLYNPERAWDLPKLAARAVGICWASAGQSTLVYNVCKDIYTYIVVELKYKPDSSGLRYLEYQGLTSQDFDVNHFPTIEDIQRRNMTYQIKDDSEYMPSSVFLMKY
jgi:hypothetical protein